MPAVLLLAGLTGLLISDPEEQGQLTDLIVSVLPPLRDLIDAVLLEVAQNAAPVSILGAIALVWGASRLVVAFDDAVARVIGGPRRRGVIRRNLGAIAAVLVLAGMLFVATILAGVSAFIDAGRAAGVLPVLGEIVSILLDLLPAAAIVVAMVVVYRVLPIPRPAWGTAFWPGVLAGIALAVLARLFVFIAPRLVGAAALLGTLATVFVALAWLALSFHAILIGAAWVGDRMARRAPVLGPTVE